MHSIARLAGAVLAGVTLSSGGAFAPGARATEPVTPDPFAGHARLTPELAAAAVLGANARIAALRELIASRGARVGAADANEDPTLSLGLAPASVFGDRIGATVALRWALPWPGTIDRRVAAAKAELAMEQSELPMLQRELAAEARAWVVTMSWVAAARVAIDRREERLGQLEVAARARVAAGDGAPVLMGVAAAAYDKAELGLMRLELDRAERAARLGLNALVHRRPNDALPPVEALGSPPAPAPELDVLIARALSARPELARSDAEIAALVADARRVAGDDRPMLGLGASVSTMADDPLMWTEVELMVALPLSNAGRDARRDEARARIVAARAERRAIEDAIAREVAEQRLALETALASVELVTRELVPAAERRFELALAGVAGGAVRLSEVIEALSALAAIEQRRVDLMRDAWLASVALDAAVASGTPGGVP